MSGLGTPFLVMASAMLISAGGIRRIGDPGPHDPATWLYAHKHGFSIILLVLAVAALATGFFFIFVPE